MPRLHRRCCRHAKCGRYFGCRFCCDERVDRCQSGAAISNSTTVGGAVAQRDPLAGALTPHVQQSAGGATARATIRVPIAPLMAAARPSSGQTSQLVRGHQADVLEQDGAWCRLLGADGYDGWCHHGYLLTESTAEPTPLRSAWASERRMSLGCKVRQLDGGEIALPLGALLDPDDEVLHGLAMNHRARTRYFDSEAELIARRAVELFRGVSYQWGGVTPWGSDCSGFIQTMYALHGTQLPRDAWMQGERGRDASVEPSDLRAADLLFFSDRDDGRITHVALSLGGPMLAHLSLANGGFGINSLNAPDPVAAGLRATFRFARRIL